MYWFRVDNPWIFGVWLGVTALWGMGGWLLATHAFRLERHERLIIGFGLGLVCYLWFANLLGRWLAPDWTFAGAGVVVLILGMVYAWKGTRPVFDWRDFQVWRWLLIGLILVWLFARLARGMAIFDDRKNISIVSTMAAGDIPPHHYMNAAVLFAYHYGFQLFGASLMRLGGLLPWSAFDLSKAVAGAYVFLLAAILGKRYVGVSYAGIIIAGVLAFATGTRYLLLLAPARLMAMIDPHIFVRSVDEVVGKPLSQALQQGIALGDGPPAPFLYAFMNGIGWPQIMAVNAGPSTMSLVILLLTWLLASRMRSQASAVIFAILFSVWAFVWETSYALFLLAGLSAALLWLFKPPMRSDELTRWMILALLISVPVAFLQGGTLTEVGQKVLSNLMGTPQILSEEGVSLAGFSLRWPPAIYSGHLSALSIFSPLELLVGLMEVGPVLLFTPWISGWVWKRFRQGDWILGALTLSAWLGFLFPVFFSYEYDRDIVRFTKHGLLVWTFALTIMLWDKHAFGARLMRYLAIAGLGLMVLGGLVIAGTELTAASRVVLTEDGIIGLDSWIAKDAWDRLPPDSEVFDPHTWRATMLTGRLTRVISGNMSYDYAPSPEWEALRLSPMVEQMLASGFRYVYVDESWWAAIPQNSRESLSQTCVQIVAERQGAENNEFRRLLDLDGCQP